VSKNTGLTKKREAQRKAALMESEEQALRKKNSERPKLYAMILETAVREAEAGDLTLARAEELLRRLRNAANPEFEEVTLDDYFGRWIEVQRPHVADSTISVYEDARRHVTQNLTSAKEQVFLTNLKSQDIRDIVGRISKTVRASTANMDLRVLRRVLEAAIGEGLISSNPAKSVRPLPETDSTERAPFTSDEVQLLIRSAPSREWAGLILIAAHTGLRLGDVLSLNQSNIEEGMIVISPQKSGRKGVKSRKVIRIPMTTEVQTWVSNSDKAFFPELSQKTTQTHSSNFRRLMAKAGVPRTVTLPGGIEATRSFHSLRHSFTSWLAEANVQKDVRQKLTGHKSSGVHSIYTHHDSSLFEAVATLPKL
jgi:integrase